MQQDADFITADFLYIFRASCAHHQEYKILTRQPPVQQEVQQNTYLGQLVSVIPMLYFTELPVAVAAVSVFYTPDDGRLTPETCRESLQ